MADHPMMQCGHTATGVRASDGAPVCVTCLGIGSGADVVAITSPTLEGRVANCAYCGERAATPSGTALAFFEYRGEGSPAATDRCATCGCVAAAHEALNRFTGRPGITDHPFVAHGPWATDLYYCGCRGWD